MIEKLLKKIVTIETYTNYTVGIRIHILSFCGIRVFYWETQIND